jgi:hypothetical protein
VAELELALAMASTHLKKRRGVHFDMTINLGHVMTAMTFLLVGAGGYFTAMARLDQHGRELERQGRVIETKVDKEVVSRGEIELSRRIVEAQQNMNATVTGINEGFREVKGMLRDLDQKLDRKADKPR